MEGMMVYCIGGLAQICFSARILVQWILSEKARKVLSPSLFWIFSVAGAYLLCLYGWLRQDFAIVLGQIVSYYIYLWNLKLKGVWSKVAWPWRVVLMGTPFVAMAFVAADAERFVHDFFMNEKIPMWLILFGSAGQLLFTFRFIYQWWVSVKHHKSELPPTFWIISLAGSLLIVSYAIFRHDPILIVGQSFGLVAYSRNLWIGHKERQRALNNPCEE